jgi:hypothetical protein
MMKHLKNTLKKLWITACGYCLACVMLLNVRYKNKNTEMLKNSLLKRRLLAILVIFVFVAPSLLTVFLRSGQIAAAQVQQRKITIGSSAAGATDVTYKVSFNETTAGTIKGMVLQFCNNTTGPLVGNPCTAPSGFNINTSTLAIANQTIGGSAVTNAYTINAASTSNTLILTNTTGNAATSGQTVTFDLGTNGAPGDGVTNPDNTNCSGDDNCTFFARILTYSNATTAAAYTDTAPGTHLDDGGIALSTASQLNTTARVQEVLQFCVGTTDIDNMTTTVANDCSGTFAGNCGTTVDLGILDSTTVSPSPVPVAAGSPGDGNDCNGAAMVQTNASNGVAVTYYAEQDTGSGKLKVPGASCSGSSTTDQCFNDSTSQVNFTAGVENFGMTVKGTNCNGTTTIAYTCDPTHVSGTNYLNAVSPYIGAGVTTTYGDTSGWAWNDSGFTSPTEIASSSGPVDNETLILGFAATPSITTPTGTYTVTSTYIATSTF